jgi:hypothetical protein
VAGLWEWICEAEQFFLGLPTHWEIAPAGRQKLSSEFRRLPAFGNSFDDRWSEKSQANHATDVALTETFALANFACTASIISVCRDKHFCRLSPS